MNRKKLAALLAILYGTLELISIVSLGLILSSRVLYLTLLFALLAILAEIGQLILANYAMKLNVDVFKFSLKKHFYESTNDYKSDYYEAIEYE
jgi:hypothetical protein